jgi:hypothetical protein
MFPNFLRVENDGNGKSRFACSLFDMTGRWVTPDEAELQVQIHQASNRHQTTLGEGLTLKSRQIIRRTGR